MRIFDFFYKKKYKGIIQKLGFENPTAEQIIIPMNNSRDNSLDSNFSLILKRESVIFLLDRTYFKKNKDRILASAFLDWLKTKSDNTYIQISNELIKQSPGLYYYLVRNLFGINKDFTFLCNKCKKIYEFKVNQDESGENTRKYGFIKRERTRSSIYDVIYCPKNHFIYSKHLVTFTR
jgi:hypothetical protein